MSIPRRTITPVGDQQQRLMQNTGLTCWHYTGKLEPGSVQHTAPDGKKSIIHVWFFEFQKIEEEAVRQHMIESRMLTHGKSREETTEDLMRMPMAIPRAQVNIRKAV